MSYNTDFSGTTLNDLEMSQEAERILKRIKGCDLSRLTPQARAFVEAQVDNVELLGSTMVSLKQLYWLRDINDKVD